MRELKEKADKDRVETDISVLQGPGYHVGTTDGFTHIMLEHSPAHVELLDSVETSYDPHIVTGIDGMDTYRAISPVTGLDEDFKRYLIEPKDARYTPETHKNFCVTVKKQGVNDVLTKAVEDLRESQRIRVPYQTMNGEEAVSMFYVAQKDLL